MPKCDKYHAKWKANMAKYKANGTGKESPKKPKPEAKKKNYSTPIVPWKSAEHLEIAPSMPASMAHSGT